MKNTLRRIFPVVVLSTSPIFAQEIKTSQKGTKDRVVNTVNYVDQGRNVTLQRIIPPSKEELAARIRERKEAQAKNQPTSIDGPIFLTHSFAVSAITYDHKFSLIKWWPLDGGENEALMCWSNIDWNHLSTFHQFESGGQRFVFMLFPTSQSTLELQQAREKGVKIDLPAFPTTLSPIGPTDARYRMIGDDGTSQPAMDFIEAIHARYDRDRGKLVTAFHRQELEKRERKKQLKLNPPRKKDLIIRYWRREEQENTQTR